MITVKQHGLEWRGRIWRNNFWKTFWKHNLYGRNIQNKGLKGQMWRINFDFHLPKFSQSVDYYTNIKNLKENYYRLITGI